MSEVVDRKKLRRILLVAIIMTLLLIMMSIWQNQYQSKLRPSHVQPLHSSVYTLPNHTEWYKKYLQVTASESRPKLILTWTKFFDSPFPGFIRGSHLFSQLACPVKNCELTDDRLRVAEADALIFHFHYKNFFMHDVPKFRDKQQRYIFYLLESPKNTVPSLLPVADFFNWTMTYRVDSDIIVGYDSVHSPAVGEDALHTDYMSAKSKMVAWFVSECSTPSHRERFVRELKKFVPVDVYGRCGRLSCPKSEQSRCLNMLEREYKFYLSLENSVCRDYVTEKFFRVINRNIIPIVMSGGNYSTMVPRAAVIDVDDYSTVKELAEHITRIGSNRTLYNAHFQWRKSFEGFNFNGADGHAWCSLCRKVNDPDEPIKVYRNMYKWWSAGQCVREEHMWWAGGRARGADVMA